MVDLSIKHQFSTLARKDSPKTKGLTAKHFEVINWIETRDLCHPSSFAKLSTLPHIAFVFHFISVTAAVNWQMFRQYAKSVTMDAKTDHAG